MRSEPLRMVLWSGLLLTACHRVDHLEMKPDHIVFQQPKDEVWIQAKGVARTGSVVARVPLQWSSADPSVATVDASGKARPVASGQTEIIARTGEIEARVPVEVLYTEKLSVEPSEVHLTPGGPGATLSIQAADYRGRPLQNRPAVITAADPKIASPGPNMVFGLNPGTTQVEVKVGGLSRIVKVVVDETPTQKLPGAR